jgi:benzoyl-CoA reductase/2-hydroxyglutaryl-CoA dehydratase subunit BcrC/BadD/HgdB
MCEEYRGREEIKANGLRDLIKSLEEVLESGSEIITWKLVTGVMTWDMNMGCWKAVR